MTEELYFNVELRNCLNAAGFSDCGENDQWNWWYRRLHCAHDASVDGLTDYMRIENAKLRELVRSAVRCITDVPDCESCALGEQVSGVWVCHFIGAAKELGVEVEE